MCILPRSMAPCVMFEDATLDPALKAPRGHDVPPAGGSGMMGLGMMGLAPAANGFDFFDGASASMNASTPTQPQPLPTTAPASVPTAVGPAVAVVKAVHPQQAKQQPARRAPGLSVDSATAANGHRRNIYVASLPVSFTQGDLHELFLRYGKIVSCKMFNSKGDGRAFGFILYETEPAATAAIESLAGATIDGQRIQVRRAKSSQCGPRYFAGSKHEPVAAPSEGVHIVRPPTAAAPAATGAADTTSPVAATAAVLPDGESQPQKAATTARVPTVPATTFVDPTSGVLYSATPAGPAQVFSAPVSQHLGATAASGQPFLTLAPARNLNVGHGAAPMLHLGGHAAPSANANASATPSLGASLSQFPAAPTQQPRMPMHQPFVQQQPQQQQQQQLPFFPQMHGVMPQVHVGGPIMGAAPASCDTNNVSSMSHGHSTNKAAAMNPGNNGASAGAGNTNASQSSLPTATLPLTPELLQFLAVQAQRGQAAEESGAPVTMLRMPVNGQ